MCAYLPALMKLSVYEFPIKIDKNVMPLEAIITVSLTLMC
jgi:hypothetical protein